MLMKPDVFQSSSPSHRAAGVRKGWVTGGSQKGYKWGNNHGPVVRARQQSARHRTLPRQTDARQLEGGSVTLSGLPARWPSSCWSEDRAAGVRKGHGRVTCTGGSVTLSGPPARW